MNKILLNSVFSIFAILFSSGLYAQLPVVNGWTQFTASTSTRIIYVSDTDGNDATAIYYSASSPLVGANPFLPIGAILPYKTLSAARAQLRNGFPDWILFKKGDVFVNQSFGNTTLYGQNRTAPMLIGSYGSNPNRPRILTGVSTFLNLVGSSASFLAVVGIYAEPHTRGTTGFDPDGISVVIPYNSILIEDCHFNKFFDHLVSQEYPYTPSVVTQSNLKVRRSTFSYAYKIGSSGNANACFIASVDTLLFEDCLLDHNGWNDSIAGSVQNNLRHNTYIYPDCANVRFINNISSRASCTGGGLRGGGYIVNNLFLSNPVNLQFGTAETTINWPTQYASGEIANNVILDSRPESYVPGWGIQVRRVKNTNVHDNIIANFSGVGGNGVGILTDEIQNVTFNNNIVYKWGNNGPGTFWASGIKIDANLLGTNSFTNNDIQMENTYGECVLNYYSGTGLSFSGNKYNNVMPLTNWFNPGGTFAGWVSNTGETGGSVTDVDYCDPERNIASYLTLIGAPGNLEDFLGTRRNMNRATWDTAYTANTVNNYIREGFGICLSTNLSEQDVNANDVTIYPNPASDLIQIQSAEKIKSLEITNSIGQKTDAVFISTSQIDCSNLSNGIYFITIEMEKFKTVKKLIINK